MKIFRYRVGNPVDKIQGIPKTTITTQTEEKMKQAIFAMAFLLVMAHPAFAGKAIGIVTTNPGQLYKYKLQRAWGWCNDQQGEKFLRNFFDSSDDCVPKPKTKIITLEVKAK